MFENFVSFTLFSLSPKAKMRRRDDTNTHVSHQKLDPVFCICFQTKHKTFMTMDQKIHFTVGLIKHWHNRSNTYLISTSTETTVTYNLVKGIFVSHMALYV